MRRHGFKAALGALALMAGLAGCQAAPYANQTVTAVVTSVEGTTVVAEPIDESSLPEAGGEPGGMGGGAAPGGTVDYERQPDAAFEVGDESVYATDAANLHPTTETGAEGQRIYLENGTATEAPAGVSVADGTLTISEGGVYELSGDFDGFVDITTTDEVRLRLNGINLTGGETPILRSAGNLVIELGGMINTIVDDRTVEAEDIAPLVESQGALFIEGDGALRVTAPGRAFSARTMLAVDGGDLQVTSGDDAFFSASDLRISGGRLVIEAGDDVAHGDLVTVVEGGDVKGQGEEGLEGERIYLRDGYVNLDTSDDGVNAAEPEAHDDDGAPEGYSEAESCLIAIGGGTITIDAKGDGIDSNGSVEVRGGETYVSALAPGSGEVNAPLDYDGAGVLTGGTMLLVGDGSMAQGFTESEQAYVLARTSGEAGQQVAIEGADGQVLANHTADQAFDVVIATAPGLENGETVQVRVGDEAVETTATTDAVTAAMGGPGGTGANGAGGEGANGQPPEPPSGDMGQQGGNAPEPPSNGQGRNGQQGGTPPEPPSGDGTQAGGDRQGGTPPEPPSGDANRQGGSDQAAQQGRSDQPDQQGQGDAATSQPPSGQTGSDGRSASDTDADAGRPTPKTTGEEIAFNVEPTQAESLVTGDIVTVTFGPDGEVEELQVLNGFGGPQTMGGDPAMGGTGGGPGASSEDFGTAATTIDGDQTLSGETLASTSADENALRVTNGAKGVLEGLTVTKSGDSTNSDASSFYGMNAAILANEGAQADISDAEVETDANGANGIFSYGEGTDVVVANTKVRTSGDNSGGIMAAGGGAIDASDLDVETQGRSSAAIRSDRGGGTVVVDGGSYATNGTGSPAIYSTADIAVKGATLTASASEGVVVEGRNSVKLEDCELSGTMQGTYGEGSGENLQAVMIYQSMSGDSAEGEASFDAKGGSIVSGAGDLFYVTNTDCSILLEDVDLTLADGALLRVAGNDGSRGWGQSGSNGGQCLLSATNQQLTGDIVVDEISSLDLTLGEGTTFEGAIDAEGQAGDVKVLLNGGTWTLTGDSYITGYEGDLTQVNANGHHLYVNGEQVL